VFSQAGELARALWEALIGLVYVRTAGNEDELHRLRALQAHWMALGYTVPLFAVNAEPVSASEPGRTVRFWNPNEPVDLERPPYSLQQLD
jgi:hypothetical protein